MQLPSLATIWAAALPHVTKLINGTGVIGVFVIGMAIVALFIAGVAWIVTNHPFVVAAMVLLCVAYWIGHNFEW